MGISAVTLVELGSFSPFSSDLNRIASVGYGNQGLTACGGANLTVYCLRPTDQGIDNNYDPYTGAYTMLAFCCVVLAVLYADQCHAFKDPSTKETRPWLLKTYDFCVIDSFSYRGFEFILALVWYFSK